MPIPSDAFLESPLKDFRESSFHEREVGFACVRAGWSTKEFYTRVVFGGDYLNMQSTQDLFFPSQTSNYKGFPGLQRRFRIDFVTNFAPYSGPVTYYQDQVSFLLQRYDAEGQKPNDYLYPDSSTATSVRYPRRGPDATFDVDISGSQFYTQFRPSHQIPSFTFVLSELNPGIVYRREVVIPQEVGYCHPNFRLWAWDGPMINSYRLYDNNFNTGTALSPGAGGWADAGFVPGAEEVEIWRATVSLQPV